MCGLDAGDHSGSHLGQTTFLRWIGVVAFADQGLATLAAVTTARSTEPTDATAAEHRVATAATAAASAVPRVLDEITAITQNDSTEPIPATIGILRHTPTVTEAAAAANDAAPGCAAAKFGSTTTALYPIRDFAAAAAAHNDVARPRFGRGVAAAGKRHSQWRSAATAVAAAASERREFAELAAERYGTSFDEQRHHAAGFIFDG